MCLYPWQTAQWQHYKNARDSQHLSHALLLVGNEGIGKHHFAKLLAQSLLCEQIDTQSFACGHCKSCKVYHSHAHPDFKYVTLPEGKKQIPVASIRKLIDFLVLSRSYQGYRVVIIEHAGKMNINAANSLLKALEEPAAHTVIILVVDQLSQMLPTIKSRCQTLHMENPNPEQSLEWMQQQDTKAAPHLLLNLADNKPLLALQFDKKPELAQQRNELAAYIVGILKNSQSVTAAAKKLEKIESNQLLNWQIKWVQQFVKQQALNSEITQTKHPVLIEMDSILQQQQHSEALWELHRQLMALKAMTDYPLNRIIFIESMLLLWRAFALPQ
jgi:DNA polymerase-3 subunit delta'